MAWWKESAGRKQPGHAFIQAVLENIVCGRAGTVTSWIRVVAEKLILSVKSKGEAREETGR